MLCAMVDREHEAVVRDSFRNQVGAFSGPDSVYAPREGALAWIEPLEPSMIALEVACGAAHAAQSVAPFVRQIVGIDLTPELLAVGAERLQQADINNVLLQEGNAEALPFVRESFDLVFCRVSLHHFADPHRAIEEMGRVIRPGGRIVLVDLIAPSDVDHERFDHLHRLLDPSHVRTFLEDELVAAIPAETRVTYAETSTLRFPIDVAFSELSNREAVLSALHDELAGGEPTGFEPAQDADALVVSFRTRVVHASTG